METQILEQMATQRQAVGAIRSSGKRRTHRRLAERISEERQLLQMIGTRAFRKKRPSQKHLRARHLPNRVVIRRKVIDSR
jgi:hypothetical protein